jgi:hypothetical protein
VSHRDDAAGHQLYNRNTEVLKLHGVHGDLSAGKNLEDSGSRSIYFKADRVFYT